MTVNLDYIQKHLNQYEENCRPDGLLFLKLESLYRLASHGDLFPAERMAELATGSEPTLDEELKITNWANAHLLEIIKPEPSIAPFQTQTRIRVGKHIASID